MQSTAVRRAGRYTVAMTSAAVKQVAHALGFALCGIARAEPTRYRSEVLAWLAAGEHGTMRYLEDNIEVRLDPGNLLENARSIICVADFIGPSTSAELGSWNSERGAGRIARYAQLDDYHRIIKDRLFDFCDKLRAAHPTENFRGVVDTAPILEREHAMRSGIGWTAKNTLLIHPQAGSHLLLGEIVTTLDLEPDSAQMDHCGTCTRCIDACPTQCITPYSVDASRCISYLTIENRGPIDASFHPAIGDWIYGCDVCQDVCPYNRPTHADRRAEFTTPPQYRQRPATLDLLTVLNWTEEDRRVAFTRSAMKRAKLEMMKRNALIVAGNALRQADDPALRSRIEQLADNAAEPELVRETARQVLSGLPQKPPLGPTAPI
jgi:epoxyqueuosine reductase